MMSMENILAFDVPNYCFKCSASLLTSRIKKEFVRTLHQMCSKIYGVLGDAQCQSQQ
jgi:hypothetical protein